MRVARFYRASAQRLARRGTRSAAHSYLEAFGRAALGPPEPWNLSEPCYCKFRHAPNTHTKTVRLWNYAPQNSGGSFASARDVTEIVPKNPMCQHHEHHSRPLPPHVGTSEARRASIVSIRWSLFPALAAALGCSDRGQSRRGRRVNRCKNEARAVGAL